jgi:ATP-dependent RNA helicase RhlE
MNFDRLGLSDSILNAIEEIGYKTATPIQIKAIPAILNGRDVMAAAQTGTGKTAAFVLPVLEKISKAQKVQSNQARALILTPTRELAIQIGENIQKYGKNASVTSHVVFGGVKINPQMMKLRSGVDLLVATPGRLLDLHQKNAIKFEQLEFLIFDEADKMLDLGFSDEIDEILSFLPKRRQNLMFSATFSDTIRKLAKSMMRNAIEISVDPPNSTTSTVEHWLCSVDANKKKSVLTHLINDNNWNHLLVFVKTKLSANHLAKHLDNKGKKVAAIHGDKTQAMRTNAISDFKDGTIQILIATDIVARGLDIKELPVVVNYDLPKVKEDYIHRIGRTGRAGLKGQAVSLVSAEEFEELKTIERLLKQLVDRRVIEGFKPTVVLPESVLDIRPFKAKKPKKPKKQSKK